MRSRFARSRRRLRRGLLILCGGLLLLADQAAAQQTAAGIVGQVRDESGAVLPGVTVAASSPSLQVAEVTDVTNAQGEYRLTPLPIGTYTVVYTLSGFQTVRQQGLRLEIGIVPRVDVVLKVGALEETVTVSGVAPVVDVTSTAASTQFTRETLELTPTSRNGVISLAAQAPGVRGRLDIGGGTVGDTPEFKTFGQQTETWTTMEGMLTSDTRIGTQGGNYFDYGTIEEARVQTISNTPDVGSRGVAITLVGKSGGNAFHGGASYAYTSHRFESNNISAALNAQGITDGNPLESRSDQGGDLGGRIIRDKLWFYGSVRYRPQLWLQLGGVKPDGSQTKAYRGEVAQTEKFSYQLSPANKLVFWGQWVQKYHYGENVNEFVAWESRSDRKPPVRTNTWKTEWQGVRGNSFVMSVLFGRWNWSGGTNAAAVTHTAAAKAAGIPEGLEIKHIATLMEEDRGGGRPSTLDQVTLRQAGSPTGGGSWTDIWRYNAKATASWYRPDLFAGNHEFKTGFDYMPVSHISAGGDRGLAGQYRLIFSNGAPLQADLYNWPVASLNKVSYMAAYLNDTWTVARRLTLDLGVRYARDNPVVPAQCRPAGAWPFTPAACIDKYQFEIFNSIAPRLYFSYDATGDAKTVVKGGWGRFYHTRFSEEVGIANPFNAITSTFRWRDLNGNRNYDAGEINLDPNGPDFITSTTAVGGVTNPDEKVPGTDQFSLTFERQLGQNFAARISGVYIRTFNEARYLNTFRPPEAYNVPVTNSDPGPDGVVGNADDTGRTLTYFEYAPALAGRQNERYMIANDPRANETHKAIDLQLVKRISNRWQFLVGYSGTKNDNLLTHATFGRNITFFNPNEEINTGEHTWEWVGKISGIYLLPAGVSVSANYDHQSGLPQSRQVLVRGGRTIPNIVINAEALGSLRLPHTNVVDVRFDKAFTLPRGQRVAARINFFNALNANAVTERTLRAGTSYLRPTGVLRPRIMEFGISYSF